MRKVEHSRLSVLQAIKNSVKCTKSCPQQITDNKLRFHFNYLFRLIFMIFILFQDDQNDSLSRYAQSPAFLVKIH